MFQIAICDNHPALRNQLCRQANAFILTCSCTSKQSVQELQTLYDQILNIKDKDKFPMVIAINKADLKNTEEDEQVNIEYLHKQLPWIKQQNIPVFETSAQEGTMVEEAVHAACKQVREDQMNIQKQLNKNKCIIQ